MYFSETTAHERLTIGSAVGQIFGSVERVKNILNDLWLDHFDKYNPEAIDVH